MHWPAFPVGGDVGKGSISSSLSGGESISQLRVFNLIFVTQW